MFILWPFTEDVCPPCFSSFFISRIDRERVNVGSICLKTLREIQDLMMICLTTGCHSNIKKISSKGRKAGTEVRKLCEPQRGTGARGAA